MFVIDKFCLRELVEILIFESFFILGCFWSLFLNFFNVISLFFEKYFFLVKVVYIVGVVCFFERINLFFFFILGLVGFIFIFEK